MSRLRSVGLVFGFVLAGGLMAHAGTIVRGTKTIGGSGGTAYVDGKIINATELNVDFDTIYNDYNGNIRNVNIAAAGAADIDAAKLLAGSIMNLQINSAAAIAVSKLDQSAGLLDADIVGDFSNDLTEMTTVTSPGLTGSESLATNLEEEIARLRYVIKRLTAGQSVSNVSWFDRPYRPGNLLTNGGFDVLQTLDPSTDGDGWTRVLTPDPLEAVAVPVSEGEGNGLRLVASGGADEGVQQTLDGLKASTYYLVIARVKPDVLICTLKTTGAVSDLDINSASASGVFETISGVILTDATPTDIVVQLLAQDNTGDCDWDHVAVYEANGNPIPKPGTVLARAVTTTTVDLDPAAGGGYIDTPDLSVSVTPPGPGCFIEVRAQLSLATGTSNDNSARCRIDENGSARTTRYIRCTAPPGGGDDCTWSLPLDLYYVNEITTAGTTATYITQCDEIAGDTDYDCTNQTCDLTVKMTCGAR